MTTQSPDAIEQVVTEAMIAAGAKQMRAVLNDGGWDDETIFASALEAMQASLPSNATTNASLVEALEAFARHVELNDLLDSKDPERVIEVPVPDLLRAHALLATLRASDGGEWQMAREQGQAEGFAAAVAQLRGMSAMKPKARLADEAELLADSLERSRIPMRASNPDEEGK